MMRLLLTVALALVTSGCGGADIGEECPRDETGSEDPCVDGAICDTTVDDRAECMKLCDDDTDCPDGTSCNGVSGSNEKACHPD